MENRILLALGILAAMVVVMGWLLLRKINQKRAFERRQSGRGKSPGDE
jgi:flagellar biogenesis protein FliO